MIVQSSSDCPVAAIGKKVAVLIICTEILASVGKGENEKRHEEQALRAVDFLLRSRFAED